jgi:1-acyl-sn-glycerol-3-phosphate acyltransferase
VRSERVEGVLDRTLLEFFYRYWFRVEVEGIENVPAQGGGLLVSNHSGALPPDAAMIAKAIREEHRCPRAVHITVEHFFKGYPGFSMLVPKVGCVAAHPANVHRLLYDEGQLVLVFPEGRKGTEKLYKDRYHLRRFGRGGFVAAAMRAKAPIVPVCVVGAEEAAPVFAQLGALRRLTGLLYFPITPTFPHFGLLGMLGYLPAKFRIRFLEPIRFDEPGMQEDPALVQTVAHEVRARIQEGLWDMLRKRRSVWFG